MRVLHVLAELKPSGAELMYYSAADLWRGEGLECEILSIGQKPGVMATELEKCGYRIHHIPFSASPRHVMKVHRLLREGRFDVVHLDTEQANFWYGTAAYFAGVPRIVRTVHNIFPFSGALRIERRVQRSLLRKLGVKSISISPSVRDVELERYGNPTELIPNWFDSRKFVPPTDGQRRDARQSFGLPDDAIVACTVAGCWSYKNHPAIIRALAEMEASAPIVYLHAGLETDDHPERALARELNVAEKVRFLGVVPDILPVLHASDVYLMPSLYEGFGCAAIEAMGAGLPAVLTRVSGLRDFAEPCAGIVWTDTTPSGIASGMRKLMEMSAAERRQIGLDLSQATHRNFGIENGARKYAQLYTACDQEKGSNSADC